MLEVTRAPADYDVPGTTLTLQAWCRFVVSGLSKCCLTLNYNQPVAEHELSARIVKDEVPWVRQDNSSRSLTVSRLPHVSPLCVHLAVASAGQERYRAITSA